MPILIYNSIYLKSLHKQSLEGGGWANFIQMQKIIVSRERSHDQGSNTQHSPQVLNEN